MGVLIVIEICEKCLGGQKPNLGHWFLCPWAWSAEHPQVARFCCFLAARSVRSGQVQNRVLVGRIILGPSFE
jgi:hypothetical protein